MLLVGVVTCTPLPISTQVTTQKGGKNEDQTPTSFAASHTLDLLELSRFAGVTKRTGEPHQAPDVIVVAIEGSDRKSLSVADSASLPGDGFPVRGHKRHSREFFGSAPVLARRPIRARIVGDRIRTVALRMAKQLSEDGFVPPLVFAQKLSEINLEPTEVEAPGTTPTTVAMVTEPVAMKTTSTIFQNLATESALAGNVKEEANLKNDYSTNTQDEIISRRDQKASNLNSLKNATLIENKTSINQTPSSLKSTRETKLDFGDIPQSDDPMANLAKSPNSSSKHINSEFKEFKIRTINNTYTLVHEKTYQKLIAQNSSPKENKTDHNPSENKQTKEQEQFNNTSSELNSNNTLTISSSNITSNESDVNKEEEIKQNLNSRQSKRILSEPAPKVSIHEGLPNSPLLKGLNTTEIHILKIEGKNKDLTTKEKPSNLEDSKPKLSSQNISLTDVIPQFPEPNGDEESKNAKEKSENKSVNIETREVNSDPFFASVASGVSSKKVKKDDVHLPGGLESRSEEGNRYRIGVITSSSELSYKQFDPTVQNDSNDPARGHAFETRKPTVNEEGNKTRPSLSDTYVVGKESNQKPNINSTNDKEELVKSLVVKGDVKEVESKDVSLEDAVVTSLPSQTSVVEPIRMNSR